MPSAKYRQLTRRLNKLRKHFLPRISNTGDYTELELDRVRGYRLLVHAEIESYLEDRARFIANESVKRWCADGKPKAVVLALLSFHLKQERLSHQDLKDEYSGSKARVREAIRAANQAYNQVLSQNNGVREDSILKILLPIGMQPSDLDQTWLNTIDSFGAARGQVAHTSIRTQQPPDPLTEFNTVEQILAGLARIDAALSKIKT